MSEIMRITMELYLSIVLRAQRMGIAHGKHITQMIDVEIAQHQFGLRLEELAVANDEDFVHDFCGIQNHMNRKGCKVEGDFVPRYSGNID